MSFWKTVGKILRSMSDGPGIAGPSKKGWYQFCAQKEAEAAKAEISELSGWGFSRHGDWPDINPYELAHVSEVATASPVLALHYFKLAIAQWESGGKGVTRKR